MEALDKFLSKLPLFKRFSDTELKMLIEKSHVRKFAPNDTIINFGQRGWFLGIFLTGEAEASVPGDMGSRRRLGLLKSGDFVGEMSLLTGEPTSADVIAITPCNLLLISQQAFSTLLTGNIEAVRVIAKTITDRMKTRQKSEEEQARVQTAWQNTLDPYGLKLSSGDIPMKILILNCGSSSVKYSYFDTAQESHTIRGIVEKIESPKACFISTSKSGKQTKELGHITYAEALRTIVDSLTDYKEGVISSLRELTAIGHRVVHGGDKYSQSVVINDNVLRDIDAASSLAPLHNPVNLLAIRETMKLIPNVLQVAVFDTGFHLKMPLYAQLYGLPYEYYEKDHIRRYGFHGISHNYVALEAAAYLGRDFRKLKIITCHLGNGASVCAIDHGRSVDTSMGLTPLEGLVMGTRCGDIDPSLIAHLNREKGLTIQEIDEILNRQSGLKGLSGISSDFRELEEAAGLGDPKALLAINVFCYRVRKYIGAYVAAIGGLDALIFTGGIGGGSALARGLSCQSLSYMGIQINEELNKTISPEAGQVIDISDPDSLVKVLVIPTDEEKMIARETIQTLSYQNVNQAISTQKEKKIPIEVSAHHLHLARKEMESLFGRGHELTPQFDLSQPGQYACKETVNLIGPKGRVEKVRVLGPLRTKTQVEISMTEEFKLGLKAPIRPSGDLTGSPGITLEGPHGACEIPEGVICSFRHIHMNPEDALTFGLKDRDVVMIRVKGERTLIFGDILVRVDPDFKLSMHIDTDEANAASLTTGVEGHLVGIQDRR